jgi:hypothetical protein
MSKRKSQVEKFYARWGKVRKDENVIREVEARKALEKKDIMEKGYDVFKSVNPNAKTEDVFAVIARDSVGLFIDMFRNSIREMIREVVSTEFKNVVHEVISSELQSAAVGLIKGFNSVQGIIKEEVENIVQEEVENISETTIMKLPENDVVEVKAEKISKEQELNSLIVQAYQDGLDPRIGSKFKKYSSRANGLYQIFMMEHKGQKGAWKNYAESVLKNIE